MRQVWPIRKGEDLLDQSRCWDTQLLLQSQLRRTRRHCNDDSVSSKGEERVTTPLAHYKLGRVNLAKTWQKKVYGSRGRPRWLGKGLRRVLRLPPRVLKALTNSPFGANSTDGLGAWLGPGLGA